MKPVINFILVIQKEKKKMGIDYHALVGFLEDNYGEFADYCGSEDEADDIIHKLKLAGGMPIEEEEIE